MWAEAGGADAALLDRTAYTQPALFSLEVALFELWRAWGVEPELLGGHSIGEVAAAYVAGVFSLEDAVRLGAARGRLMQSLAGGRLVRGGRGGGGVVSIGGPEAGIAAAVAAYAPEVSLAAVNGPQQVVIAGTRQPVEAIAEAFAARGARVKPLRVSHAFHSPR